MLPADKEENSFLPAVCYGERRVHFEISGYRRADERGGPLYHRTIGIPSLVLMERAALAVFCEAEKLVDKKKPVWVLCGSGNNGGDGIAIARMLHLSGYGKFWLF